MRTPFVVHMFTCALLCLSCSSEPFVSLRFYGPRILKTNVKRYLLLGDSDVTVGCSIEDLPAAEINGTLYLYQKDILEEKVAISHNNVQLIWNGPIVSDPYFKCEVAFTTNVSAANVQGSEVVLQHYSEDTNTGMCFPTANVFLLNEVVLIACLSDTKSARWISDEVNLVGTDDNIEISPSVYVTTNNIVLNSELINADCQMSESSDGTLCSLEIQSSQVGLQIAINPDTFNGNTGFAQRGFLCVSNVPTDRISWQIESTNGNILNFYHREESKINFSISHTFLTSKLQIETKVENVISISCRTSRSGYVVTATAYNVTEIVSGEGDPIECNNIITIIVIVLVTFTLICITVITVLAGLLRRQCNKSQGGSDVSAGHVTAVKKDPPIKDLPYYAKSSGNDAFPNKSAKQRGYISVKDSLVEDGLYYSTSLEDRIDNKEPIKEKGYTNDKDALTEDVLYYSTSLEDRIVTKEPLKQNPYTNVKDTGVNDTLYI